MIKDSDLIIDIHEGYDFHRINSNSIGSTLFASTPFALEITQNIYNMWCAQLYSLSRSDIIECNLHF
jgi:hypothetical protein